MSCLARITEKLNVQTIHLINNSQTCIKSYKPWTICELNSVGLSRFNVTENIEHLLYCLDRIELNVNERMVKTKEISIRFFYCVQLTYNWRLVSFITSIVHLLVRFRSYVLSFLKSVCRLISKYVFTSIQVDVVDETKVKHRLIWFGNFPSVKANWSSVFFKSGITQITFRSSRLSSGQYVRICVCMCLFHGN